MTNSSDSEMTQKACTLGLVFVLVLLLQGCAPVSEKQDPYFLSAEAIETGSPRTCAGIANDQEWICRRSVKIAERWRDRLEFKSFTAPTGLSGDGRSGEKLWRPYYMNEDEKCFWASYMPFNGTRLVPGGAPAFSIEMCGYDAADLSRITFSCPSRPVLATMLAAPLKEFCPGNMPDGPRIVFSSRDPIPPRTLELAMTHAFEPPLHIETTG